jgi:hypothetical protein
VFGPLIIRKYVYNCSRIFTAADHILYCTCGCENMYIIQSIHIWERVQDEKKEERQKCPAGTRQTDGKNLGLVWRNRKKISQIIKDYFHLPFFLLIILWEQHISIQNYEIISVQDIHISRWPHEIVISFSKVYIWDLGVRFG